MAVEQLVLRDQPPGVLDQIPQHGKRLRHERDARLSPPQALVRDVQAERLKRSHELLNVQALHHSSTLT